MADDGRGWHGDSKGHAKAGSQSSGNKGNPKQHADAGRKGGQASGGDNS
jgi:general stress protein YciG